MSFEEEMRELETQLAEMERLAREIESPDADPSDLLHELADEAKHVQDTIERARRAAHTEAAAFPNPDAASS